MTGLRLVGLWAARTDLFVDEAQYWSWAQTPAWGYFSKPPLLAWLIGLTQQVCGGDAACVRSSSPVVWMVTALAVFAAVWTLGGRKAALWAGAAALLAPGAAFSARIASTDAPLLMFWSLAFLALVRLRAGGGRGWLILMALALGLGLLSKYAMAYWLGCLIVAAVADDGTRRLLRRWDVWLALAAGAALLIPNIAWNLAHDGATFRHTAENAAGEGWSFDPVAGLEFVAAQFGLAGPVAFALLIAALMRFRTLTAEEKLAVAFSAPVFLALTGLALLGRAHANWAATGLIGVFVLTGLLTLRWRATGWLIGGLVLGGVIQALLLFGDHAAPDLSIGGRAPYSRLLGWNAMAREIHAVARREGASLIVAETRADTAALLHELRDEKIAVLAWPAPDGRAPEDHFQMTRALNRETVETGPVLALSACDDPSRYVGFAQVRLVAATDVATGPGERRRRWVFRLDGPIEPVRRPQPCRD